jgi:hypothetical protein
MIQGKPDVIPQSAVLTKLMTPTKREKLVTQCTIYGLHGNIVVVYVLTNLPLLTKNIGSSGAFGHLCQYS